MLNTIEHFNCLLVKEQKTKKPSKELLKETIKKGFVFDEKVIANYSENELLEITKGIGLSGEQMNSSFHKSWEKIKEAKIEQLVLEQVIHYFTTYGFESLGLKSNAYIPNEKLEVPQLKEDINLKVIKGFTKEELKEEFLNLVDGIALKDETIKDLTDIALELDLTDKEIENIGNKELKVILFDYLNKVPSSPVEFLRFAVYKSTEKTLLIKSEELIEEIKENKNIGVIKLFEKYPEDKLAEIFYRFKPIFLAFRTNPKLKKIINRIRRLAISNHKPMPEDYLNTITSKDDIDLDKLKKELDKVNIFRKIRLAYALNFRLNNPSSIIYRIRNGKSFTTNDFKATKKESIRKSFNVVVDNIVNSLDVKDKKIYIPEYIDYALPATEKQFTGNLPIGTSVRVDNNMIFGVYWDNVKNHRIDLDLSLIDENGSKFGWDAYYRDEDRKILFSGDMTDADNGASELFYINNNIDKVGIMSVNYFNYDSETEVPFKIVVGQEEPKDFGEHYMINPNNILALSETTIKQKQKVLGLVYGDRFYFAETNIGNSITSGYSEISEWTRKYMIDYYTNSISLNDILVKAGANIVDKDNSEIDLSLENLDKNTIIKLLK